LGAELFQEGEGEGGKQDEAKEESGNGEEKKVEDA
jgi:hypothetical protein